MNQGIFPSFIPLADRYLIGSKPNRITTITSGSGTFYPLASNILLRVTLVGGGGGGACPGAYATYYSRSGNGGSAGATVIKELTVLNNTSGITYSVGTGGGGGAAGAAFTAGTGGGNTSFGQLLALGGEGGQAFVADGTTVYGDTLYGGGVYNNTNNGSTFAPVYTDVGFGAYGGRGGGYHRPGSWAVQNGYAAGNALPVMHASLYPGVATATKGTDSGVYLGGSGGGCSLFGIGGAGGNGSSAGTPTAGSVGSGYGAGGGGGGNAAGADSAAGGAGTGGLIIIEEFITNGY